MKSLRFRSWMVCLSFTLALLLGCVALNGAYAEEVELPPPAVGGAEDEPSIPTPPPQSDISDSLPEPGSGEQELPAPSLGEGEDINNQVNIPTIEEDVFLPAPAGAGSTEYSMPVTAAPARSATNYDDSSWRSSMSNRPAFTLGLGMVSRTYGTTAVLDRKGGLHAGASYRVADLAQTVFLHAYTSISFTKVGDVVNFRDVRETLYHFGGLLEVGIGRRLSLFGGLMMRKNDLKADQYRQELDGISRPNPVAQLENVGEALSMKLGLGIQYDFHVIPHGSLGVRGYAEQDLIYVGLAMSMEPAPRKRASLSGF